MTLKPKRLACVAAGMITVGATLSSGIAAGLITGGIALLLAALVASLAEVT